MAKSKRKPQTQAQIDAAARNRMLGDVAMAQACVGRIADNPLSSKAQKEYAVFITCELTKLDRHMRHKPRV